MNKKLTSTIMATALLSTNLIPASASSDTIEISAANKGKLINQLATRIWDAPRYSNDTRVDNNLRGKSIYTIQINSKSINQSLIDLTDKDTSSRGMLERAIRDYLTKLKVGDIVKLVCIGFRDVEENGNRVILSDSSKRYVELEYKIISGGDTFYLSDLYDGLFLTEEGQKILESSKEARTMYIKKFSDDADGDQVYNDVIKVSSKNKIELDRFIKWIDKSSADVDILAGDGNAPILLTKSDELPRATKRYLRELIDTEVNRDIVVSIVGGEKAISNSVRKQLK
ncbi:cell wall-binding repeat-containing protein [Peptacetobacter hiranonis]|uniref:cell wall-binding repeat-containing protein n=1 Tax=Peptacetobacter hiranonis TaxID=89152 RepID=UPI003D81BA8C